MTTQRRTAVVIEVYGSMGFVGDDWTPLRSDLPIDEAKKMAVAITDRYKAARVVVDGQVVHKSGMEVSE